MMIARPEGDMFAALFDLNKGRLEDQLDIDRMD